MDILEFVNNILTEFRISCEKILTETEAIPEEDIFEQGRFAWPGQLTLAKYISSNTYNHIDIPIEALKAGEPEKGLLREVENGIILWENAFSEPRITKFSKNGKIIVSPRGRA
jgi:hypothetical protein